MPVCFRRWCLPAALFLLALGPPTRSAAQIAPDSVASQPARHLYKLGLSLTRLRYEQAATNWQVLLPLSLGFEQRLDGRHSLYALAEADCQLGRAATRRRRSSGAPTTLPTAAIGVGGRYYYGRPAAHRRPAGSAPEWGRYVALEASGTFRQSAAARTRYPSGSVVFTPALYALWGVQNRLRPHLLYDFSAGLGLTAPSTTRSEYPLATRRWDVAVQANIRVYGVL